MTIRTKLLDELLKDYKNPEDLIGKNGLIKQLTKRLVERAMEAKLTEKLGYPKNSPTGRNTGNSRNGYSNKHILTTMYPRDRNGKYEPKIAPKNKKRFNGFGNKIISMYSRGMSTH